MMAYERHYGTITNDHLKRLTDIAERDFTDLVERKERLRPLQQIAICLCQGAAQHYVDGAAGVKDFDVYVFVKRIDQSSDLRRKEHPLVYPFRRRGVKDFGIPDFGVTPSYEGYIGRRCDLMGRSIEWRNNDTVTSAIQRYLTEASSATAKELAKKAVVVLSPSPLRGKVIWPLHDV